MSGADNVYNTKNDSGASARLFCVAAVPCGRPAATTVRSDRCKTDAQERDKDR